MKTPVKLFTCSQSEELASSISKYFGKELGKVNFSHYSDGEFQPSFEESIRGARIFIIGSTHPSSENLMEILLMLDAAKRASARHITAVIPYFGWARQDRKDKPRVPIGAKLIAKLLESAGATRIMTMDLHADQIQGFFEKPVDHLFASSIFVPYIKNLNIKNLTIASPDMGGSKRSYAYSKFLKCDVVICYKQRSKANKISHMELIGDVKNKNVILVDDIVFLKKKLDIRNCLLFGGSWGSTLALLFCIKYSEFVDGMILRGVFTGTLSELEWFLFGLKNFLPEHKFFDKSFSTTKELLDFFYEKILIVHSFPNE